MIGSAFNQLWQSTGLFGFMGLAEGFGLGNLLMIVVGLVLLYLAISKGFEPLLLIPIGFGCILSNIPLAFISGIDPNSGNAGFIKLLFDTGIETGLFPILILRSSSVVKSFMIGGWMIGTRAMYE